jgi:superfamily II DNA or RNA helicase
LEDFYIPVLNEAIEYKRIAGFFSSSSLAIAARGIKGLIKNNGKMKLLISPRLSKNDIKTIENSINKPEIYLENKLMSELDNIQNILERNYVYALGWLLVNDMLEIKVVVPKNKNDQFLSFDEVNSRGIFHQKVGIFKDLEGNIISFSGSINETSTGWLENIEEFKVFKLWEDGQKDYCKGDIDKFDSFWNSNRNNVEILDLPKAVKKHLIDNAPEDIFNVLSVKNYRKEKKKVMEINSLSLFDYQEEAVKKWENNNRRLILEMATGTGKTRTAIGCITKLNQIKRLVVIIATPQNTLTLQWKNEIEKLNIRYDSFIIADSTNTKWKTQLENSLLDLSFNLENMIIVYTTHATCSSNDFIKIISKNKRNIKYFFVGDEAHGLGAYKTQRGLLELYDYRLGLSATPKRWYDDIGTEKLYNFFGNDSFEFSINDALNNINPLTNKPYLVNYTYKPYFTTLTEEELGEYKKLSKKISKLSNYSKDSDKYLKYRENLIFNRANIHKSADNKYEIFNYILEEINVLKDTLIFVSPEQIDNVIELLNKKGIVAKKFTQEEGTVPLSKFNGRTERQYIIDKFKENKYDVLVAIKCLDEGIDIPSAKNAILMASSTNPREYIQRIGRVIRQSEDKKEAIIYDIIIKPNYENLNKNFIEFEKSIFEKEMARVLEIAENASNNAEAYEIVYNQIRGGV